MELDQTKKSLYGALTLLVIVIVIVIVYSIFWGPAKRISDSYMPARVINVSAEGKVVAEPDIAHISFSVVSRSSDPEKLADLNNKTMNAALGYVKSQGVDAKDIKTTQYNLYPTYGYIRDTGVSYITGYELTQSVQLTIRDLTKVARILGALPEYGINQISSISYDVDKPETYMSEARAMAFKTAKEKADSMAKSTGVSLGSIVTFSEYQQGPGPIPYYSALGKGGGVAESVTPPSVQPGSQEIIVNVSVMYEIR